MWFIPFVCFVCLLLLVCFLMFSSIGECSRKFYHVHENTVYHEDGLKNDNFNIEENFENVTASHKKDELKNEDNLETENKDNLKINMTSKRKNQKGRQT